MQIPDNDEIHQNFIRYLLSLAEADQRGKLAVMRRGLSDNPVDDLNLARFINSHIPDSEKEYGREQVYYRIAALFALHPASGGKGNLGNHLRQAATQRNDMEAADRRFAALLTVRFDDLNKPLRSAIMMLKQQEVPVNWFQLFKDLKYWDHPQKIVQRSWANSFWGYVRPADQESISNQPDETRTENE